MNYFSMLIKLVQTNYVYLQIIFLKSKAVQRTYKYKNKYNNRMYLLTFK